MLSNLTMPLMIIDIFFLLNAVKVLFGIGFIIFVHELGHFLAAKKVGIRVETFSLGFGPRVFGFRKGNTDYRISALPLGGYVKMAGETPGEVKSGNDDEFQSKTVGQRAFVLSAGVIMNFISAFLIFPLAFSLGVPFTEPVIGNVEPGSPAWHGQLEPGDRIIRIDDAEVIKFEDIVPYVALSDPENGILIEFDREGEIRSTRVYPTKDEDAGLFTIGIRPASEIHVEESSEAYRLGVRSGDIVKTINGKAPDEFSGLDALTNEGETLDLEFLRGTETIQVQLPSMVKDGDGYRLGVSALVNVVAGVRSESTPARIGLKKDDVILSANGEEVYDVRDLRSTVASTEPGGELALRIRRGEDVETIKFTLSQTDPAAFLADIAFGINPSSQIRPLENSPLALAGVKPGAQLIQLGDDNINSFADIRKTITEYEGDGPLAFKVKDDESVTETEVLPIRITESSLGIGRRYSRYIYQETNVLNACRAGFRNTAIEITRVFLVLHRLLFTRSVSAKTLGGPVTIAVTTYKFAEGGLSKLLIILGILSINLAIFNLLPIPILDGGQLLFLAIEKIKGSPVSERVLGVFQWAGLILILALLLFVTFQDIQRVF